MYLGYESSTGNVYEGAGQPEYATVPSPVLTQACLVPPDGDLAGLPRGILSSPFAWLFREDLFDPITRIRRGRLFQAYPDGQPRGWLTKGHPTDDGGEALRGVGRTKSLFTYWPCTEILKLPQRGLGARIALGQSGTVSLWKIVQAELVVGDDVLVTLKALTAFGLLPDIHEEMIPDEHRAPVVRAVSRVLDSAFRESPTSVVDQCRTAAAVLLGRWMIVNGAPAATLGKDLSALVKQMAREPFNLIAASSAAEILRLLHTRAKANIQEAKGYRLPLEDDAETALSLVGFMIRDLGWAK